MREVSAGIIPTYLKSDEPIFLIIKQHKGHWGFPKGHVESKEDTLSAARREVKEEVGIRKITLAPAISHTERYVFQKNGKKVGKKVTYYLGFVGEKKVSIQKEEVAEYVWLPYHKAIKKVTFKGSRNALAVLAKKYQIR